MILVTGGTGFLGEELLRRFEEQPIRVVGRNEGKLIELKQKLPHIETMPGDLSDKCIARKAIRGVNDIYHLAAFKHVGMAETETYQCIESNVTATQNLLSVFEGNLFVAISTDKAAQVAGVYGATKMLMEKMIEEYESFNQFTSYRVVRYGNVLYSTGSVLCKWRDLMLQGKEIIVTDPDATRFFWTREQAVDHIFECIETQWDCTPYIPKMKAMRIGDLLEAMMRKYVRGYVQDGIYETDQMTHGKYPIKIIGLQPGENFAETMDGKIFSNQVEQYTMQEILELI